MQPAFAGQQRAGTVGGGAGFAQRRPALGAGQAVAAARHEHHHDVVADAEIVDAVAEPFDHAGGLVAEHHRRRSRTVAVDHREIGMAQPGGADLHQHLAAPGRQARISRSKAASILRRAARAHPVQHCGLIFMRSTRFVCRIALPLEPRYRFRPAPLHLGERFLACHPHVLPGPFVRLCTLSDSFDACSAWASICAVTLAYSARACRPPPRIVLISLICARQTLA